MQYWEYLTKEYFIYKCKSFNSDMVIYFKMCLFNRFLIYCFFFRIDIWNIQHYEKDWIIPCSCGSSCRLVRTDLTKSSISGYHTTLPRQLYFGIYRNDHVQLPVLLSARTVSCQVQNFCSVELSIQLHLELGCGIYQKQVSLALTLNCDPFW